MKLVMVSRIHATEILIFIFFVGGMILATKKIAGIIFLILFSLIYVFFCFVYVRQYYNNFDFYIGEHDFVIWKGFLVRKKITIPHMCIQEIIVYATPIQKLFSTRTVLIKLTKKIFLIPETDYNKVNLMLSAYTMQKKEGIRHDNGTQNSYI